ncbi:hypothetical protein Tco_0758258 [Tanacetum coccineum]
MKNNQIIAAGRAVVDRAAAGRASDVDKQTKEWLRVLCCLSIILSVLHYPYWSCCGNAWSSSRGAVIGWSTNKDQLTKATFDYLISDGDHEHGLAIKLVKVIPGFRGFSKFMLQMKESWKVSLKEDMKKHRTWLQLIKNGAAGVFISKRYKK